MCRSLAVDVEQGIQLHQTVLHIGACAHLGGAAHKYTHLTGTDFGEQLLLPDFGVWHSSPEGYIITTTV